VVGVQGPVPASLDRLQAVRLAPAPHEANVEQVFSLSGALADPNLNPNPGASHLQVQQGRQGLHGWRIGRGGGFIRRKRGLRLLRAAGGSFW